MNLLSDDFEMYNSVHTLTERGGVLFATDHESKASLIGTLTKPFERLKKDYKHEILTYSLGRYSRDNKVNIRDVALHGAYVSWKMMEPFTFTDSYGNICCNVLGDILGHVVDKDCPTNHIPAIDKIDMDILFDLFQGVPPSRMELQIARYHMGDRRNNPDFDYIELMVDNEEVTRDGVEAYERFFEFLN